MSMPGFHATDAIGHHTAAQGPPIAGRGDGLVRPAGLSDTIRPTGWACYKIKVWTCKIESHTHIPLCLWVDGQICVPSY